jgi:hypothetical protein
MTTQAFGAWFRGAALSLVVITVLMTALMTALIGS